MKKFLGLVLTLALLGGLSASSRAQTVSGAGGPINAAYNIPFPSGTPACAVVALSTFSTTQIVAAATSQRLGLYVVNSSTLSMGVALNSANPAGGSRPPNEWLLYTNTFGGAGTVGIGPGISSLPLLPGQLLRAHADVLSTQATNSTDSWLQLNGPAAPQGKVYAVAESTGATTNVQAILTVCDFQSQ